MQREYDLIIQTIDNSVIIIVLVDIVFSVGTIWSHAEAHARDLNL